jgi:hypothetical protein
MATETKELIWFPEYLAYSDGKLLDRVTGAIIKPLTKRIRLRKNGVFFTKTIGRLLLETFKGAPPNDGNSWVVWFKDNDNTNFHICNLEWKKRSEIQTVTRYEFCKKILEQFNVPEFNEKNTGLYPNAIECPQKPGYYYIPFTNMPVVINRYGRLFNLATKKEHYVKVDRKWYIQTKLPGNEGQRPFKVHRIVAMLFCEIPDRHKDKTFAELHVNHIDGMTANNFFENLEWVTNLENQQHARKLGLWKSNPNDKPVIGRNVVTGEIVRFGTIVAAAKHAFVASWEMKEHVNSISAGHVVSNDFVYKLDNGNPWPTLLTHVDEDLTLGKMVDLVAKNVETGQTHLFLSFLHACRMLKLNRHNLKQHRWRHGPNKPHQGWIFYPLEEILE